MKPRPYSIAWILPACWLLACGPTDDLANAQADDLANARADDLANARADDLANARADDVAEGRLARPPNVLLIVVDTLRRDHLGCYGYEHAVSPNIDALAAGAVRYDAAWSQAPWTTASVGSLLTSQYPSVLGIHSEQSILKDEHLVLSEALRDAGYRTAAVVSHSFCSSRWNFDQGFDVFDEANVQGHSATTSPSVTDRALELLDEIGQGPFFLWLHYFDPHFAYIEQTELARARQESYRGEIEPGMRFKKLLRLRRQLNKADILELKRLYDSELALTDQSIGRVLDALRERGLEDETIVVLTADHGEEFLDHGRLGHAKSLHSELIHVPLLVRRPGQPAGVEAAPVGLVDVFPTILAAVGEPVPAGLAGRSLLEPPSMERVLFSETSRIADLRAAIGARHKVIRDARSGTFVAFDLGEDPGERRDLAALDGAPQAARLLRELDEWAREVEALGVHEQTIELSGEELGHLEALGYGGDSDE